MNTSFKLFYSDGVSHNRRTLAIDLLLIQHFDPKYCHYVMLYNSVFHTVLLLQQRD